MVQLSTPVPNHVAPPPHHVASMPNHVAVESGQASRLLHAAGEFLVRRRIVLSAILLVGLIAEDILNGVKPHDLLNFRDPASVFGLLLVLAGLATRSWAAGILRKDAELTTTGPYRLIRNPLYLGSFLMMFGFCELIGDPENIFFILGPMLLLYIVKVRSEERLLALRFPVEWPDYVRRTPRFIPRAVWVDLAANWKGAQWMRSREYQALGATLAALVALEFWQSI